VCVCVGVWAWVCVFGCLLGLEGLRAGVLLCVDLGAGLLKSLFGPNVVDAS